MFSNSIGTELDYHDHFKKLFDFQQSTSLYDLAGLKEAPPAEGRSSSSLGSLVSMIASPLFGVAVPPPQNKALIKALKACVRQWKEKLDDLLEEARREPHKIPSLKETIMPLILNGKISLLTQKIKETQIENEALMREISLLEKLVQRTITTAEPNILSCFSSTPRNIDMFTLRWSQRPITHDHPVNRMIDIHRSIQNLCSHSHDKGEGWSESLIEEFNLMTDETTIKSLGNDIGVLQVLEILRHLINNREQENKLPLLIGGLPFEKFSEIVLSLDLSELHALNRIFKNLPKETIKWLEERITEHRESFIDCCNHLRNQIDALCKQFRLDTSGMYISETNIHDINSLCGEVELRSEQTRKLYVLCEDVISDTETEHLFKSGLKKEYDELRIRLTSTVESDERPAGCVWGILYRRVFLNNHLQDTENALEIFSIWSIFNGADYREIGLLGEISDVDFKVLEDKRQVFIRAQDNLAKLGIKTIDDWKLKKIFNKNMLSNYLCRQEVQAILNNRN